ESRTNARVIAALPRKVGVHGPVSGAATRVSATYAEPNGRRLQNAYPKWSSVPVPKKRGNGSPSTKTCSAPSPHQPSAWLSIASVTPATRPGPDAATSGIERGGLTGIASFEDQAAWKRRVRSVHARGVTRNATCAENAALPSRRRTARVRNGITKRD